MNKKVLKWILGLLLLGLIILGASVLYRRLSPSVLKNSAEKTAASSSAAENETAADETRIEVTAEETTEEAGEETVTIETRTASESGSSETPAAVDSTGEAAEVIIAPDFSMQNKDGETVKLSDFFDKPAILNFWASWCPPCREEMPYFEEAYKLYGDEFNYIFVDLTDGSRETVETAKQFIEEQGYSFPVYFDTEYEGAYTYGISSIPMTFFLDEGGEMLAYRIGALTRDMLFTQLEKMREE